MFKKEEAVHPEVRNIRKGMQKVLSDVMENRLLDVSKKLDALTQDIETLKTGLGNLYDIVGKHTSQIAGLEKERKSIEELQARAEKGVDTVIKKAAETEAVHQRIRKLKVDTMSNDIALLQKRVQWLESSVARIDVQTIQASLQRIENELMNLKLSQPAIIE